MKIAYLINQYPQPSQSFIRREIGALESLGATVERFTVRRWKGKLVDAGDLNEQSKTRALLDAGAPGLIVATLGALFNRPAQLFRAAALAWRIGRRSGRGVMIHVVYLAEACVLAKRLRACGAQHLHAHFGTNSATVAMLSGMLGGPGWSFTCHGPEEFDSPAALALGEKIARAKFVVAISEFGRSQLLRWCAPDHWPKVHVVRCGLDAMFLGQPTSPVPDVRRFCCVGRLSAQKGQVLLLEALAALVKSGERVELALVGDGEMRADIELHMRELGICPFVTITGYVDAARVRDELLRSRAMVLPSFAEGLPVVIMEALALGRPVVSTSVAGTPELVRDGQSGWLVAPGSVEQLVEAMREVLRSPVSKLEQMGRAGADAVRQRHDAAKEAAKLLRLFVAGK